MRKFSDWPIWLRLVVAIWLCLMLAWGTMIAWETRVNRDIAVDQAHDMARSINEMTLAGLTGMMITGTVGQRNVFLDQIRELEAVRDLRVVRGEAVVKQFGPGQGGEAQPRDEMERAALADGQPHMAIESSPPIGENLHVVFPAIASSRYLGKNCLACHLVSDKTPLGVVSMRISLAKTNASVQRFRDQSVLFALLISLPLMAVVYLFIRRFVTRPLHAMERGLADIAKGEGDLSRRLDASNQDEIGLAAQRFNQMLSTIADLVRQVGASATAVSAAAHALTEGSGRLEAGSNQQTAQSQAASEAVDELAGHISEIAGNSGQVRHHADESLARSAEGRRSLTLLRTDIAQVEEAMRRMAQAENDLMASTNEITAMTRQVREIADQTNMLALNASIEAARAGEQGRGFAVVADEVRKLAERSASSASEIDRVTQSLNQKSEAVRLTVVASLEQLTSSHVSAERVAGVLDSAQESVGGVRDELEQIVTVTTQQRQVSESVALNIEAIAERARDNDLAIRQTVSAALELEQLAESLRESVSRFRI
ncbi:methyl-accepting chemotaxis protein [Paludibacterium yongneupense]|uniref:methyl-accepting chemotaxis protein n=1 Tax=Paludibacterium yongneupense TaxID=400061 RepID=UPI00041576CA|nr:methyl-accepting chemotaxis protein [Paludibacterium yongneupense]